MHGFQAASRHVEEGLPDAVDGQLELHRAGDGEPRRRSLCASAGAWACKSVQRTSSNSHNRAIGRTVVQQMDQQAPYAGMRRLRPDLVQRPLPGSHEPGELRLLRRQPGPPAPAARQHGHRVRQGPSWSPRTQPSAPPPSTAQRSTALRSTSSPALPAHERPPRVRLSAPLLRQEHLLRLDVRRGLPSRCAPHRSWRPLHPQQAAPGDRRRDSSCPTPPAPGARRPASSGSPARTSWP